MSETKNNNIVNKFVRIKNELYKQIGDGVIHEKHGNFQYYTSGSDYVVVHNLKNEQEMKVGKSVEITFDLSKGIPTERKLLNWYRQALTTAKKEMRNSTIDNLKKKKADLLKEVRDINKNLKDVEKD